MKNKVEVYKKENGKEPIMEFLISLPEKHRAKAIWEIELLREFGTDLKEPHIKAITGKEYKGLWELRIKFAGDISRIFYFMSDKNNFILLHGFVKKTEKTSKRELDTALRYMEDYKRRLKNE
jgi:phage-related protein